MHRENPKPFQDPNVNLYKLKENEKSVIIYPKHRQSCEASGRSLHYEE